MNYIEQAQRSLRAGKAGEAISILQSATGLSLPVVALGLTIDSVVDSIIVGAIEDVETQSLPSGYKESIKEELWRVFERKYSSWTEKEIRALGLHLNRVSIPDCVAQLHLTSSELQEISARKEFIKQRKWIETEVRAIISDLVVADVRVESQLRPIVKRLGREALAGVESGELTPKEALKAFTELGKLLAQITGELVEKKELQIGPTEQFAKILEAAERMPKEMIECKEYKLIE